MSILLPSSVYEKKQEILSYAQSLGIEINKIQQEELLFLVFVHKSYAADFKTMTDHNERLEFLGDSVLGASIAKLLFLNHPEMAESQMTLYKIALVREETLAEVAREIGLDSHLFLSRGEERSQGRTKDTILGDALEALLGYLYLEFGIGVVDAFIEKYLYPKIKTIRNKPIKSYKTLVQEYVQRELKITPEYIDTESKTDQKGNILEYKSEIFVNEEKKSEGFGSNKKKAQEDAAKTFYLSSVKKEKKESLPGK